MMATSLRKTIISSIPDKACDSLASPSTYVKSRKTVFDFDINSTHSHMASDVDPHILSDKRHALSVNCYRRTCVK